MATSDQTSATVNSSGKTATELQSVPPEVLAAVRAAQPDMRFTEAEAEVRNGRNYYDVAGRLPDGSEIELDLLQQGDRWVVVETQRDIAFAAAPEAVRSVFARADTRFKPMRVIESRQDDGMIIYELYAPAAAGQEPRKVEVKFDGKNAEVLTKEWAH
jgi:uncharacterized membrane protein YkoI